MILTLETIDGIFEEKIDKRMDRFNTHEIYVKRRGKKIIPSLSLRKYYPFGTYSASVISKGENDFRKQILDFKNGLQFKEEDKILNELYSLLSYAPVSNTSNYILIPIPASTMGKTLIRYSRFMPKLANQLKIKLEMDAITTIDHEPNKGSSHNRIKDFTFNPNKYRSRGVVLFDDIITSGKTFEQTAQRLLNDGVSNVIGLFLGRTVRR